MSVIFFSFCPLPADPWERFSTPSPRPIESTVA
jgi:hypothetical protein